MTPTHKAITLGRESLIQSFSVPSTREEVLSFLGIACFLCSWIPSFSFLAAHCVKQPLTPHMKPFLFPLTSPFRSSNRPFSRTRAPSPRTNLRLLPLCNRKRVVCPWGHRSPTGTFLCTSSILIKKLDLITQGCAP